MSVYATYATFFASSSATYQGGAAYLVRTAPGQLEALKASIEKTLVASNGGRNVTVRALPDIKDQFQTRQKLVLRVLTAVIFLLLFDAFGSGSGSATGPG